MLDALLGVHCNALAWYAGVAGISLAPVCVGHPLDPFHKILYV